MQKSTHKEFIRSKLEVMLGTVDSSNELERTGCAQGIGYCAASHLDMTLERLQGPPPKGTPYVWISPYSSVDAKQDKGGLFSFLSSKDKADSGPMNNTVILAFGYIATFAPTTYDDDCCE